MMDIAAVLFCDILVQHSNLPDVHVPVEQHLQQIRAESQTKCDHLCAPILASTKTRTTGTNAARAVNPTRTIKLELDYPRVLICISSVPMIVVIATVILFFVIWI